MSDLASGRYPDSYEEWLLDGQPVPPYRQTISRRDIANGASGLALPGATTVMSVFAVPVQIGDIFNYVSFISAVAGGTLTHSWIAIYNGVATGAALLGQVTDNTTSTGWAVGAQKLTLAKTVANIGTVGTPQGGGSAAVVLNNPTFWGIAVYQVGTTLNKFDGAPGGVQVALALTGQAAPLVNQVPMVSTSSAVSATATAPAVLPTMTAVAGGVPYFVLSRQ